VEVWQTSNLRRLRICEENTEINKEEEEEKKKKPHEENIIACCVP